MEDASAPHWTLVPNIGSEDSRHAGLILSFFLSFLLSSWSQLAVKLKALVYP